MGKVQQSKRKRGPSKAARTEREQAIRDAMAVCIRAQRAVDQINAEYDRLRLPGVCVDPDGYSMAAEIKRKLLPE